MFARVCRMQVLVAYVSVIFEVFLAGDFALVRSFELGDIFEWTNRECKVC